MQSTQQTFDEYLQHRDNKSEFDVSLKARMEKEYSQEQMDALKEIIKKIDGTFAIEKHDVYTLDEFKRDIEIAGLDMRSALQYMEGEVGANNLNSIMGALLASPSDENLKIFTWLVDECQITEFHSIIDIRNASFDCQNYRPGQIAKDLKDPSLEKIVKDNAHKMLVIIDENASTDDKNKLGLVNLSVFWDDMDLTKKLFNDSDTYLKLKGQRGTTIIGGVFLHPKRREMMEYVLSHDRCTESELGALHGGIIAQGIGLQDASTMARVINRLRSFPSFIENVIPSLDLSFWGFMKVGASTKEVEVALQNYREIIKIAAINNVDLSPLFIGEKRRAQLEQALGEYGVHSVAQDPVAVKKAVAKWFDSIFMYQPQLIDALPVEQGIITQAQKDAMFFGLIMKEDDRSFLQAIGNEYNKKYIEEALLTRDPDRLKAMLAALGIVDETGLKKLTAKLKDIMGNDSRVQILDNFEYYAPTLLMGHKAVKTESELSIGDLLYKLIEMIEGLIFASPEEILKNEEIILNSEMAPVYLTAFSQNVEKQPKLRISENEVKVPKRFVRPQIIENYKCEKGEKFSEEEYFKSREQDEAKYHESLKEVRDGEAPKVEPQKPVLESETDWNEAAKPDSTFASRYKRNPNKEKPSHTH